MLVVNFRRCHHRHCERCRRVAIQSFMLYMAALRPFAKMWQMQAGGFFPEQEEK